MTKPTLCHTVKSVISGHSKIDKTHILMTDGSLMKVKSIAEYSPWSILQYFWPTLSNNQSWKPIFGLIFEWPLKTGYILSSVALDETNMSGCLYFWMQNIEMACDLDHASRRSNVNVSQ